MKLLQSFIPCLILCFLLFGHLTDILGQSVDRKNENPKRNLALTEIPIGDFEELTQSPLIEKGFVPELRVHENMIEEFYYSRYRRRICRYSVYYYLDGVRIQGIPNLPANPYSWLMTIKGGHPAEFGNNAHLSKAVNRIPSWRYENAGIDTQLITLHRTRSYRYRNSIL